MSVAVRDARAAGTDRAWIESVYREYSTICPSPNTGLFPSLGEIGHGTAEQFGRWYADRKVQVLTILRGDQPAGFAVIAPGEAAGAVPRPDYRMAEFFVSRQARRGGVGAAAAPLIFDRFAGRWEILEHQSNRAWRSASGGGSSPYTRTASSKSGSSTARFASDSAPARPGGLLERGSRHARSKDSFVRSGIAVVVTIYCGGRVALSRQAGGASSLRRARKFSRRTPWRQPASRWRPRSHWRS